MISINTVACEGCNHTSPVEQGVKLHLVGNYGAECITESLDNEALHDYKHDHLAVFHSGSPDAGLGECNNVRKAIGVTLL